MRPWPIQHGAPGILNEEGTLTLTDSTVSGNATAAEPYAGIWNYGGGIYSGQGGTAILGATIVAGAASPGPGAVRPGATSGSVNPAQRRGPAGRAIGQDHPVLRASVAR